MTNWCVYMIRCSDGSLYTGVTTDIERRFREHKEGKVGAKYTRSRMPIAVVYVEACASRSEAQAKEAAYKKLSKDQKEAIIKDLRREKRVAKQKKKGATS